MQTKNYPAGTKIRTEDGYVFTVLPDGSVSNGDLAYDCVEQLAQYEIITVPDDSSSQK